MDIASLVPLLENDPAAEANLRAWGVVDTERAARNLRSMAATGLTLDLLAVITDQLAGCLPSSSDPDRVLNNVDRFLAGARNPLAFGGFCERDSDMLPTLVQIFSASQSLSEYLIRDPDAFDLVRLTDGQPTPRLPLRADIVSEITKLTDERSQMAAIRRIKQRETLRIAYGDFVRRQSIAIVTRQISYLAEALVEAAVQSASRKFADQKSAPRRADGTLARFAVIALGKLGGEELNYSSDIDLVFVCDSPGGESSRRAAAMESLERLARHVVKLLADATELGAAYRVDLRLRPRGQAGPLVNTLDDMLHYYDSQGRTWERQAYVKARVIAGNEPLGRELLTQLQPWVYRRYLNRADITGIKALKRRIEQRAEREGADHRDVKTGWGGLRDIEFVIQFLQLLNGGDLPEIRVGNTIEAIVCLEQARCLTSQEASLLVANYAFLRKVEHRLQIMYDLQTHSLPESEEELRKLAIRLNYDEQLAEATSTPLDLFQADYNERTKINRQILNHLLHSAFPDDPEVAPEMDLVLDPEPSPARVAEVLAKYGFHAATDAFHYLLELSTEKISFLSTRRCRHFLAAIAPALLTAVAATPNPDFTLRNLARVSDSLGGKGVLWELFSFHPPTLHLYVRLCAASPYLSDLLVGNPGMIDELLDSLLLDKLPDRATLSATLTELCRGAEDLDPILLSFKNSLHLRVGVRDILGKEQITKTHQALSDIMETILTRVAEREFQRLVEKHGEPIIAEGPRQGERCELLLVALGKLGGREPNYHSDCDVIFLYEAEGTTLTGGRKTKASITNQHFFGQLAQRIVKDVTKLGPYGKLFEMDARLRPTGQAGPLAISLHDFARYYSEGQAQLWERQALCKARVVFGSELARIKTTHFLRQAILSTPWRPEFAEDIRLMRERMEQGASPRNLKRGVGGTVDVEFVVQMLQLKHFASTPSVLATGTIDAISQLREHGHLSAAEAAWWANSYLLLRRVESGLRLLNTTERHDLPTDRQELRQLAFLLGLSPAELETQCQETMSNNRFRFLACFQQEAEHLLAEGISQS